MSRIDHLKEILSNRIAIFDGATGTVLQTYGLTEEDFRGTEFKDHPVQLKGNNEVLCLTRPEVMKKFHMGYLEAGANIIETDSFCSNAIAQEEYHLVDHVKRLNVAAAQVAVAATKEYAAKHGISEEKRPFVAGSIGPTSKTASTPVDANSPQKRQIDFDTLYSAYLEQIEGLLEGGVDLLIIETIFDALNCKAAIAAAQAVFEKLGRSVPLWISVTIVGATGRTLAGQSIEAFCASVAHARPLIVGFNCIADIEVLKGYLQRMNKCFPDVFLAANPNAGLPDEVGRYTLTGEQLAQQVLGIMKDEQLVNIVGGCCGTNPTHIAAIKKASEGLPPRPLRLHVPALHLSGLDALDIPCLEASALRNNTVSDVVCIGEQCNVAGSRMFLNAVKEKRWEAAVNLARKQIRVAKCLDISFDHGDIPNSAETMREFLCYLGAEPDVARVPFCIDSSSMSVIEAGLKLVQGKCLVNSISLKEGEAHFIECAKVCKKYGAAVIVMAFDENGQATSTEKKVEIALRSYDLLVGKVGFLPEDIIFDLNVLTIATGMEEHNAYARNFIDAVAQIKAKHPLVHFSGGISNLSFSFRGNNAIRQIMHTVFLHNAARVGLDMSIFNPSTVTAYASIPEETRRIVEGAVMNTGTTAQQLVEVAQRLSGTKAAAGAKAADPWEGLNLEQRLSFALVSGDSSKLGADIAEAAKTMTPVQIIEGPLSAGLEQVGKAFAKGEMFLPQVLRASRVMKEAVDYLEPILLKEKEASGASDDQPVFVLATVKGDVHDIGKNIVGVVLSCNGYKVVDLGINTPPEKIVAACVEHKAVAIGVSGLISPSLNEMAKFVEMMQEKTDLSIPILIGGATTSPLHTALALAPRYRGPVAPAGEASEIVGVLRNLTHKDTREHFIAELCASQEKLREAYYAKIENQKLVTFDEARRSRFVFDAARAKLATPSDELRDGKVLTYNVRFQDLFPLICWDEFFSVFKLRGTFPNQYYPNILNDSVCGAEAKRLIDMCKKFAEEWDGDAAIEARGIVGIYPANAVDESIELYPDNTRTSVLATLHTVRKQLEAAKVHSCVADFVAPKGTEDYVGALVCTGGFGTEKVIEGFKAAGDDERRIVAEALTHRFTEALACYIHADVAARWHLPVAADGVPGIRPAIGYPQLPDHTEKRTVFDLMHVTEKIGVRLSSATAMVPTGSICALLIQNAAATYSATGPIGMDQVEAYAKAKQVSLEDAKDMLKACLPVQ